MSENNIDVVHLKSFKTSLQTLNDTSRVYQVWGHIKRYRYKNVLFPWETTSIRTWTNTPEDFCSNNDIWTAESQLFNDTTPKRG